jgi:hypothetical protein
MVNGTGGGNEPIETGGEARVSDIPPDPGSPDFAHPAEAIFARILDFYRIEWAYEARTFPLAWDADGSVIEAFTPDFFLPAFAVYIELTTLRPQLSSLKNRKVRLMHELYPDVNVKLLKRRELRELMVKYGLTQAANQIQGDAAQRNQHEW